jgi:CRISPR-associated protein Cas1
MGTLYVDRENLELRPEKGAVVLYEGGVRARTVPLALLERVVIRADVLLRSALLRQLAEAGVGVAVLGRRPERTALLLGRPHADLRLRLAQYQAALEPSRRAGWARALLAAKLAAQTRVLERARELRGPTVAAVAVADALAVLAPLRARLANPGEELSLPSLLGLEGAAAAAYFPGLASLFPPAAGFLTRNRRPPRDPVNACLSLAYTLLHFEAARAAHQAGLDPLLGFFHAPAYGRESLASDLIEPLRPRADFWVWQLFRRRDLRLEHFGHEGGACLLGKTGRRVFYQAFEAQAPSWRRWLRRACRGLVAALAELEALRPLGRFEAEWAEEA